MDDIPPQGQNGTGIDDNGGQVPQDSLASGFLENIPEEDRNVVERYVKDWDGNVTRKFQEIHDSYKPYKEFGEVEEIKAWKQVADTLTSNPQYVFELLAEELGVDLKTLQSPPPGNQTQQPPTNQTAPVGNQSQQAPQFQALPEEFQQKFDQQQQLLEQLAKVVIQDRQSQQAAQQEVELDNYLKDLRSRKGDFDEEWVLLKMYNGMDGEKAVDEFHQKYGGMQRPTAPPPLTGGGIPAQQQNVKEMSRNDVQSLVAGILGATKQQE